MGMKLKLIMDRLKMLFVLGFAGGLRGIKLVVQLVIRGFFRMTLSFWVRRQYMARVSRKIMGSPEEIAKLKRWGYSYRFFGNTPLVLKRAYSDYYHWYMIYKDFIRYTMSLVLIPRDYLLGVFSFSTKLVDSQTYRLLKEFVQFGVKLVRTWNVIFHDILIPLKEYGRFKWNYFWFLFDQGVFGWPKSVRFIVRVVRYLCFVLIVLLLWKVYVSFIMFLPPIRYPLMVLLHFWFFFYCVYFVIGYCSLIDHRVHWWWITRKMEMFAEQDYYDNPPIVTNRKEGRVQGFYRYALGLPGGVRGIRIPVYYVDDYDALFGGYNEQTYYTKLLDQEQALLTKFSKVYGESRMRQMLDYHFVFDGIEDTDYKMDRWVQQSSDLRWFRGPFYFTVESFTQFYDVDGGRLFFYGWPFYQDILLRYEWRIKLSERMASHVTDEPIDEHTIFEPDWLAADVFDTEYFGEYDIDFFDESEFDPYDNEDDFQEEEIFSGEYAQYDMDETEDELVWSQISDDVFVDLRELDVELDWSSVGRYGLLAQATFQPSGATDFDVGKATPVLDFIDLDGEQSDPYYMYSELEGDHEYMDKRYYGRKESIRYVGTDDPWTHMYTSGVNWIAPETNSFEYLDSQDGWGEDWDTQVEDDIFIIEGFDENYWSFAELVFLVPLFTYAFVLRIEKGLLKHGWRPWRKGLSKRHKIYEMVGNFHGKMWKEANGQHTRYWADLGKGGGEMKRAKLRLRTFENFQRQYDKTELYPHTPQYRLGFRHFGTEGAYFHESPDPGFLHVPIGGRTYKWKQWGADGYAELPWYDKLFGNYNELKLRKLARNTHVARDRVLFADWTLPVPGWFPNRPFWNRFFHTEMSPYPSFPRDHRALPKWLDTRFDDVHLFGAQGLLKYGPRWEARLLSLGDNEFYKYYYNWFRDGRFSLDEIRDSGYDLTEKFKHINDILVEKERLSKVVNSISSRREAEDRYMIGLKGPLLTAMRAKRIWAEGYASKKAYLNALLGRKVEKPIDSLRIKEGEVREYLPALRADLLGDPFWESVVPALVERENASYARSYDAFSPFVKGGRKYGVLDFYTAFDKQFLYMNLERARLDGEWPLQIPFWIRGEGELRLYYGDEYPMHYDVPRAYFPAFYERLVGLDQLNDNQLIARVTERASNFTDLEEYVLEPFWWTDFPHRATGQMRAKGQFDRGYWMAPMYTPVNYRGDTTWFEVLERYTGQSWGGQVMDEVKAGGEVFRHYNLANSSEYLNYAFIFLSQR